MSPTLSVTQAGIILGTAAYMAPEQARGKTVDRRADIWAFGCVLFEMLTGRRAFDGDGVTETLARVLTSEPNWTALPGGLSHVVKAFLSGCFEKDANKRIGDMAVARFALGEGLPADANGQPPLTKSGRQSLALALALIGIVAILAGLVALSPSRGSVVPTSTVTRFSLTPPDVTITVGPNQKPAVGVFPDGTRVVYRAEHAGSAQLYSRSLDQLELLPIRGTEGATTPFISPDGRWIGFVSADGVLKKVAASGGAPVTIAVAGNVMGATWLSDDSIVYGKGGTTPDSTLWKVPAAGGTPVQLTKLDTGTEVSHYWPEAIAGQPAIIFTIRRGGIGPSGSAVALLRLDTGERRVLVEDGSYGRLTTHRYLMFFRERDIVGVGASRGGVVLAAPFDVRLLRVSGPPAPALENVYASATIGAAQFAGSGTGLIAYLPAVETPGTRSLMWVDRRGTVQPIASTPQNYEFPRLSPDGRRAAIAIAGGSVGPVRNIWMYDLIRGTSTRFTFEKEIEAETPAWTPDGAKVAYVVSRVAGRQMMWKLAEGTSPEERLTDNGPLHLHLGTWSPRGDMLIAAAVGGPDAGSLWILEKANPWSFRKFLQTSSFIRAPAISPDGHWLAYSSNETNRSEVYVQAFPGAGGKYQVSSDGGFQPVWAKSSQELFYRTGDAMMSATFEVSGDKLQWSTPRQLFALENAYKSAVSPQDGSDAQYDVSVDGKRFLMIKALSNDSNGTPPQIIVVQHFDEELKRLVPTK
jgi:serine/threonine-protein kinase